MKISGSLKRLIKKMEEGYVERHMHPSNYDKALEKIEARKKWRSDESERVFKRKLKKELENGIGTKETAGT